MVSDFVGWDAPRVHAPLGGQGIRVLVQSCHAGYVHAAALPIMAMTILSILPTTNPRVYCVDRFNANDATCSVRSRK
jgi:hypothetical protein